MTKSRKELLESILNIIGLVAFVIIFRIFIASPFEVKGDSMYTTLFDKDYIMVDRFSYHIGDPNFKDIVVVHPPHKKRGTYYVKRIIGLPGDTLEFKDNSVYRNGEELTEDYIRLPESTKIPSGATSKITIPEDSYFVMGDNRTRSTDSRSWLTDSKFRNTVNTMGSIPEKNVIGKVRLVAFNFTQPFDRFKWISYD